MRKIFFASLIVVLASCGHKKIFEKHLDIENYSWNRYKKFEYTVPVKEKDVNYDIYIAVRHITQYPFANLMVGLSIYYPGGEERYDEFDLILRDKSGKLIGDGTGDIWDISIPVIKNISFKEAGNYKFEIENLMPKFETPGIMQIGLIVKKADKKTTPSS